MPSITDFYPRGGTEISHFGTFSNFCFNLKTFVSALVQKSRIPVAILADLLLDLQQDFLTVNCKIFAVNS